MVLTRTGAVVNQTVAQVTKMAHAYLPPVRKALASIEMTTRGLFGPGSQRLQGPSRAQKMSMRRTKKGKPLFWSAISAKAIPHEQKCIVLKPSQEAEGDLSQKIRCSVRPEIPR